MGRAGCPSVRCALVLSGRRLVVPRFYPEHRVISCPNHTRTRTRWRTCWRHTQARRHGPGPILPPVSAWPLLACLLARCGRSGDRQQRVRGSRDLMAAWLRPPPVASSISRAANVVLHNSLRHHRRRPWTSTLRSPAHPIMLSHSRQEPD